MSLIVIDNDYNNLQNIYNDIGKAAEAQLTRYLEIMQTICDNAISDGDTHANLQLFVNEASKMSGQVSDLTTQLAKIVRNYISTIDKKDSYLYE